MSNRAPVVVSVEGPPVSGWTCTQTVRPPHCRGGGAVSPGAGPLLSGARHRGVRVAGSQPSLLSSS